MNAFATSAQARAAAHYELDGKSFDQRIEAMAYADIWGFHYSAIQWVDPEAPWA